MKTSRIYKGFHLFPTTKMTRRHYMLGYAGWGLDYKNIVELWVTIRKGVRVKVRVKFRVRVRVRAEVRFRVSVRAFFNAKQKIFSPEKMTSCHFGGWKQVTTVYK